MYGEVVRDLSARRNNYALWHFHIDDVHNTFECEFVEVKTVAHIVVGRYGFGVVIYHDRAITLLANGV